MAEKVIRLSAEHHAKLKAMAAREKRLLGAMMEVLIDERLEDERDSGA